MTGRPVGLALAVTNPRTNLVLNVHVVLRAPSGLSLSGGRCTSPGLCSATYQLGAGKSEVLKLMAIANQEGDFTLEANVTWRVGDGRPNVKSASLTLTADPAVYGDADVTIHASLTEVKVGEPVKLTLSATNSTDSLPMAVTLTLSTPPGWSLSGAGFAEPCAGHCIAIYPVGSGERKSVALELMPG